MPSSNLLLASKVVVTRQPPQIRTIPGVETAILAIAGITERGPKEPRYATSFEEWVSIYGSYIADSDLAIEVEGFFRNRGTGVWTKRIYHYTDITDDQTGTAAKGEQDINDRGGVAGPAILESADGPFDLEDGEVLEVNIDAAGADALTINANPAEVTAGNVETYALVDGDTLVYQAKRPGSAVLSELKTIVFLAADPLITAIGAATAQEIVNVINRDGIGIRAELVGANNFKIISTKKGADAEFFIDGSSTSISAGKFDIAGGSYTGSGDVDDINAVTATELAGLLTALPLSSGTATVSGNKLVLTSTGTGLAASVVVTANTTAAGIFAGVLPITQNGSDAAESPTIKVLGRDEGTYIDGYVVVIEDATSGDADRFNLRLTKNGATKESWPNLSMDENDDRYVETFIAANSSLIDVQDLSSPAVSPNNLPKLGSYSAWAGSNDGLVGLVDSDFIGSDAGDTGLYGFDQIDNISLLAVPGRATSAVHNAMIQYCEVHRNGECFAILDSPVGLDAQGIKNYVQNVAALEGISEYAALYWKNLRVLNPSTAIFGNAENLVVPSSGFIAGVFSRVDQSKPGGVYEPPANVEKSVLFGVVGFEDDEALDERKRDVVYPVRINPLTAIGGGPRHIDGSRTLKGDGSFPSVSESRGVIFITKSIKDGILFAKHRNNDRKLRMEVKRTIEAFLLLQYQNGAFRGDTPQESFFVDVSDALNPPEVIFANQLRVRIGLATQKPAEFIIVEITQDTRALEERLANELG